MTGHVQDDDLLAPPPAARAHLDACPLCSTRRDAQLAVRSALRALPREAEVSTAARAFLEDRRRRTRAWRRSFATALAVTTLVAAAGLALLQRPRGPLSADLADELALDHLHYERRVDVAEVRGDPATLSAYFAKRLGFTPHYGAIEAATFEGAKPCRIAGKWTALAWLDRAGHWLSLFTMPQHEVRTRGCVATEGVRVCGAPDPRGGARVLVGDLPEPEMLRLLDDSLR